MAVSLIVVCTAASLAAADFGTPEEAKAMLEKAVAAVKQDKAKALDAFNAGEAGFKDRDLLCGAPTRRKRTNKVSRRREQRLTFLPSPI